MPGIMGRAVGVDQDQVEDYALRKGIDGQAAEKILAPVLRYVP